MRWRRRRGDPRDDSREFAERLTKSGLLRVAQESVALDDRATVQRWLRDLRPGRDQCVFVHRPWGTVVAVADGRNPVAVFFSDGKHSWYATPPGTRDDADLTPEQVEYVVLESLISPARPDWPVWRDLT